LARAFIYAQARALLVSHWEVNSDATVKLITTAIREMARDPRVGRAEAMRRSMLALIDKGEPHEAHPAYWAPRVRRRDRTQQLIGSGLLRWSRRGDADQARAIASQAKGEGAGLVRCRRAFAHARRRQRFGPRHRHQTDIALA
jgi:hypothetical protein